MSNSIDQRIVEMEFDNAQFEKGVAVTLASLKKLDSSLEFKEGVTGIKNIDKALSKVDFSSMDEALTSINSKLSVLGVAGFTAIQRVTDAALNLGTSMVRAVAIDPLTDGLEEYNLKLDSLQTIQSNTLGKNSFEEIEQALDGLNTYADKTIYSFSEMTKNIGLFTAAGVGLQESTDAIQGMSNLAAASGVNAQRAANAMYQMSQALSIGKMTLLDWKSMENAGLGGRMFQNELIRTAEHMGIEAQAFVDAEGSFRESLKDGWATSEVLIETLRHFMYEGTQEEIQHLRDSGYTEDEINHIMQLANTANDAATKVKTFNQLIDTTKEALGTGWATTWELIIGDLHEATELWTRVSQALNTVIDGMADARNGVLQEWHEFEWYTDDSGLKHNAYEALRETLFDIMDIVGDLLSPLKEAFDIIFGTKPGEATLGETLAQMTIGLHDAVHGVKEFIENSKTFTIILGAVRIAATILFGVIKGLATLIGGVLYAALTIVTSAIKIVGTVIESILTVIFNLVDAITSLEIMKVFRPITDFLSQIKGFEGVVGFFEQLRTAIVGIFDTTQGDSTVFTKLQQLAELLGSGFGSGATGISSAFSSFGEGLGVLVENARGKILDKMPGILASVSEFASTNVLPILEKVGGRIREFFGNVYAMIQDSGFSFKPLFQMFEKMGSAIGTFLNSVLDNGFSFDSVQEMFSGIWSALSEFAGTSGSSILSFLGNLGGIISGALGSLGSWLSNLVGPLSSIIPLLQTFASTVLTGLSNVKMPWDSTGVVDSTKNLSEFTKNIAEASETVEHGNTGQFMSALTETITGFNTFATSVAAAVTMIKNPAKTISDFLSGGINGLVDTINQFVNKLDSNKILQLLGNFAKIGSLAGILVGVEKFSKFMDALTGTLTSIKKIPDALGTIATEVSNLAKEMKKVALTTAILEIALAVVGLVAALYILTTIDPERLDAVLPVFIGIVVGLAVLLGVIAFLTSKTDVIDIASMQTIVSILVALSVAMLVLSVVIKRMGTMDPGELIQGGIAVAAFMALASLLLSQAGKIKAGAFSGIGAAFIGLAAAIGIIATAMIVIGNMPEDVIKQGAEVVGSILVALTLVAVIMGVMSHSGVKPGNLKSLLALSVAVALLAGVIIAFTMINDPEGIQSSVAAVIFLMLGMAAVAKVLSGINTSGMLKGTGALVLMAVAIGILAASVIGLSMLSSMGIDTFAGTLEIVILLVAIMAACAVIGHFGPQMAAAEKALLMLTALLIAATAAIVILSMLDVGSAWMAIGQFAVMMAILVGAFALMAVVSKFASEGILVLSVFVSSLAALVLAIGISFGLFALSLMMLSTLTPDAAKNITDSIGLIGTGLWEQRENIALGIMGIGYALMSGLLGLIPMLMAAVLTLIGQLVGVLIAAAPIVGQGVVQMLAGLVDGFAEGLDKYGPTLIDALLHLGEVLLNALWEGFSGAVNLFNDWLYDFTGGLMGVEPVAHDAAEDIGESMASGYTESSYDFISALGGTKDEAISTLEDMRSGAGEKAGEIMDTLKSGLESGDFKITDLAAFDPAEVSSVLDQLKSNMSEGASGAIDGLTTAVQGGAGSFGDALGGFTDQIMSSEDPIGSAMNSLGITSMDEFGAGVEEGAAEVDLMEILNGTGSFDLDALGEQWDAAGVLSANSYYEGFKGMLSEGGDFSLMGAMETLSQEAELTTVGVSDGQAFLDGMKTGIGDLASTCGNTVQDAVSTVGRQAGPAYNQAYSVGSNLGSGLLAGLAVYESLVSTKAASITQKATEAMKAAAKINSPSKITREIGKGLDEGLIVGMGLLESAVADTASGVMMTALSVIDTQSQYLDGLLDDIEENPVIRPVLDLDDYMMGINTMNSLLPSGQLSMASRIMGIPSVLNPSRLSNSNSAVYNIDLNYTNDADANRIFSDLTREIRSKNLMEA